MKVILDYRDLEEIPDFKRREDNDCMSSLIGSNAASIKTELSLRKTCRTVSSTSWHDTFEAKRNLKANISNHGNQRTVRRRNRMNLSLIDEACYPKAACSRSVFSNKRSELMKMLYETTGRSVSSASWLDNFDSKCSQKSAEYNGSTTSRNRKKLLTCLSQVNRVSSSKSLKLKSQNKIGRRDLSSVVSCSALDRKYTNISAEIISKRKVEWYIMEIGILRKGNLNKVDGWIEPVLTSLNEQTSLSKDALKVDEYIKKVTDRPHSVKRFMKKKLDKDVAMQDKSMDNGAFSLWSKANVKSYCEDIEKKESLGGNVANEDQFCKDRYIIIQV